MPEGQEGRIFTGGRFTRRGVLKGFGIGAAVTAAGGATLYSAVTPGKFLWRHINDHSTRTFTGHSNSVNSVAFSPDGRTALSGSKDNTLKLWDVASGKELRTFTGHSNPVHSVAFSPDGRTALSGSKDNTSRTYYDDLTVPTSSEDCKLKLWDVASGREIRTFEGVSFWVRSVAFSPDGRNALSGDENRTLKLWDVASGKEIRTFKGHSNWQR
ncbi:MAG: WD40 repeat domain-containing protein [Alphaproteobacteria bacterium]